jgi:hypothetical protein
MQGTLIFLKPLLLNISFWLFWSVDSLSIFLKNSFSSFLNIFVAIHSDLINVSILGNLLTTFSFLILSKTNFIESVLKVVADRFKGR